jgi:hypothetical protein
MRCYLYFVTNGEHTRIGVSSDPLRRWARGQLVYTFELSQRDWAELYKQRLHHVLGAYRVRGGWFNVTPLQALQSLHNLRDQDPFNRMPIKRSTYYSTS